MLTDQCIVYFANDWGADNRTSAHHLARFLGRSNQMLYVEASGMRTPEGSGHDLKRRGFTPGPKFKAILRGLRNATLDGQIATTDEAIAWLEANYPPS